MNRPHRFAGFTMAGVLALGGLAGCGSTTQNSATGVNRNQVLIAGGSQLEQRAAQQYDQMLQAAQQKGVLNTNPAQVARLRQIASRIIPQTANFRADAPRWNWQVNEITSKSMNAFCMPGGKIIFLSGIIDRLGLTDDEIAAIMAHEIAHALREHSREQASISALGQLGLAAAGAYFGLSQTQMQLAGMAADVGLSKPFSRNHEREADSIGLELMARAGYNPQAAISLWQKMNRADPSGIPQFLSTHPNNANRMQSIQALLPRVMPLYQQAGGGRYR